MTASAAGLKSLCDKLGDAKGPDDLMASSSPFVRFVSGTVIHPPNTIYESALDVLKGLAQNSAEETFRRLVQEGSVAGNHAVMPEATWYALLADFIGFYGREFSETQRLQGLVIESLQLMVEKPHEKAWNQLEHFLLDHVDDLSGWNKSWIKQDAERRNVSRGEDGNYYFRDHDGVLVQIIGEKTLPETHLDFLTDAILRTFGPIRKILNVFCIFAISEDFRRKAENYPKSLRLYIPERQFGMLSPRWHRMQFHQVRTVRWRPQNNLCDPEWLSEQLLAEVTDSLDRDLWQEHIERFKDRENKLDADCLHKEVANTCLRNFLAQNADALRSEQAADVFFRVALFFVIAEAAENAVRRA